MYKNIQKINNENLDKEIVKVYKQLQELKELQEYYTQLTNEKKSRCQKTETEEFTVGNDTIQVVYKKASIQVDTKKVQAIPNWEKQFGKEKQASRECRVKLA